LVNRWFVDRTDTTQIRKNHGGIILIFFQNESHSNPSDTENIVINNETYGRSVMTVILLHTKNQKKNCYPSSKQQQEERITLENEIMQRKKTYYCCLKRDTTTTISVF
jgi:hypothetical protein